MYKRVLSFLISAVLLLTSLVGTGTEIFAEDGAVNDGALFSASEYGVSDNSALLEALARIESYDGEDYTPQSYSALMTLYNQYAPIAESMSDQQDIDDAVYALLEAISDLKAYLKLKLSANVENSGIGVEYGQVSGGEGEYTAVFGDEITVTAPEIQGCVFGGWLETVSKRVLSDSDEFTFTISVNTSLEALYLGTDASILLFMTESGQIISFTEKTPSQWSQLGSLDDFIPSVPYRYGYTNGRWDIPSNALSLLASGEQVSVYPEYDDVQSEIPSISHTSDEDIILELHFINDSQNSVGSFIMNSCIPYSKSVQSVGMLFYYKKPSVFNPASFDVNINNKMLVSQFDTLYEDIYITDMKRFTSKYNWAVRGYVNYYDNGELKTVYSNQVNIIATEDIHESITLPAVAPTCTSSGLTEGEVCFICGAELTAQETVPALGHDYVSQTTLPTCTQNGYITNTCSRCGNVYTEAPEYDEVTGEYSHPELLATGHSYGDVTVTTPATLTQPGECEAVCSVCSDVLTQPYYIATGSCGDNVSYSYDLRTGELIIGGSGAMTDYVTSSDSPFYNLSSLTSVTVESGVNGIGACAFYGCSSLESVSIAGTVTNIGNRAFYNCSALTSITIPSSVSSIDYHAFYGCRSLTEVVMEYGVASIGNYAFSNCTELTDVVIPNSVTSIGNYAFNGCTSLEEITIPGSVSSVGDSIFSGCTALNEATLLSGVRVVGKMMFLGCSNLETVNLPSTISVIDSEAFKNCVLLTSVTLPSSLISIYDSAFSGCANLTHITVPSNVSILGNSVFAGCTGLISAPLPNSVQSMGSGVFSGCANLTAANIPTGITKIPNNTFTGCSSLQSATINGGITEIEEYAFKNCTGLTALSIPASVTAISDTAFTGCSSLASITVDGANAVYDSRNGCNALIETASNKLIAGTSNTVIPSGVTSINSYAFAEITQLTQITIPSSVTSISSYAFKNCTGLESVTVPDSVTVIPEGLFYGCSSLESVNIPSGATSVDTKAFYGCSSLVGVTLPSGITTISSYTFSGCSSLSQITIPSAVETISGRAFYGCSSLTVVTIPDDVKTIDTYAFCNCTGITQIILPARTTKLGTSAFRGCTSMTDIYINNISCTIGASAYTIPENAVIHGYLLSTAKDYADNYSRTFVSISNS